MIEYELPLNDKLGESFPAMNFDFPYIFFWGVMNDYVGGHVPWHWHEEMEFCHIIEGEVEYHFSDEVYVLEKGDAMFVNADVLHMICPHNGCDDAIILPQVFHKLFLCGYHRSAIDEQFYRPIANAKNLPCLIMRQKDPDDAKIIQKLDECWKYADKEETGYQIYVRNYMSSVWLDLYNKVKNDLNPIESAQNKNNSLLTKMLGYMNEHFAEKISLEEIANSACISERECIRTFKKHMQMTPFQYLQQYRVETAANMLLNSDASITEIAMQCGFETSSYFSKTFKQMMNYTPKKYRDVKRQNCKYGFVPDSRILAENEKEED